MWNFVYFLVNRPRLRHEFSSTYPNDRKSSQRQCERSNLSTIIDHGEDASGFPLRLKRAILFKNAWFRKTSFMCLIVWHNSDKNRDRFCFRVKRAFLFEKLIVLKHLAYASLFFRYFVSQFTQVSRVSIFNWVNNVDWPPSLKADVSSVSLLPERSLLKCAIKNH